MGKSKTAFFCNNCGYESTKWVGKCPSCNEWNTFTEEVIDSGKEKETHWDEYHTHQKGSSVIAINEVNSLSEKRINEIYKAIPNKAFGEIYKLARAIEKEHGIE